MRNMVVTGLVFGVALAAWGANGASIDLSKAVVVLGKSEETPLGRAGEMLLQEIAARTDIELGQAESLAKTERPAIVVAAADALPAGIPKLPAGLLVPGEPEGYVIWVDTATRSAPTVCLIGRGGHGAVFAAGRLLRMLHMSAGRVTLDLDVCVTTAPKYALRMHHIGYDNMNNTFDAWSVEQFEQYCRDLLVFGTNAIELTAPLDPTLKESPHMKRTMWDMNIDMSRVAGSYGMDVCLFLPTLEDVEKPGIAEEALKKRDALFRALPNLDDVFVPGGDPGSTPPEILMPWLAKLAEVLQRSHPKAKVWVSNQGFEPDANNKFFDYLRKEKTDWLGGVVFGPWTKISLREMRERTPGTIAIRDYPDITHTVRCQYPVPEWDRAFAHTLGREPVNPRPLAMARIHELTAPLTIGFGAYSEGVNDDVNKVVWSSLAWDPKANLSEVLRDYGRYFIGDSYADDVADGLFAFEQAWKGPVAGSATISQNFKYWRALEKKADEKMLKTNWRFQQGLLRAYYDEYVRRRLAEEMRREDNAMKALAEAPKTGVEAAIKAARAALDEADSDPEIAEFHAYLVNLGRALFDSIGVQLDVANYQASGSERGAVLEYLDEPLNDRVWLEAQFQSILNDAKGSGSAAAAAALKRIDSIVKWEDPGPGGYYDDLGNARKQTHLVRQGSWADDPGGVAVPEEEFCNIKGARLSWQDQVQTLFGTPLRMRYDNLDPKAQYKLRVTYAGRYKATMTLAANGTTEIHGPVAQPDPVAPLEYAVPKEATANGVLELEWRLVKGRGCQVAEVWLLKQ